MIRTITTRFYCIIMNSEMYVCLLCNRSMYAYLNEILINQTNFTIMFIIFFPHKSCNMLVISCMWGLWAINYHDWWWFGNFVILTKLLPSSNLYHDISVLGRLINTKLKYIYEYLQYDEMCESINTITIVKLTNFHYLHLFNLL